MSEEITYEEKFAQALGQDQDPLLNEDSQDAEDGVEEELQEEVDESPEYDPELAEGEEEEGELDESDADDQEDVEGPSPAMVAVARLQGVPDELLSLAKSDEDVNKLLAYAKTPAQEKDEQPPEDTPEEEELSAATILGEDYDESDPAHKALDKVIGVLNEERKTTRLLLAHASHQLQQQQRDEALQFQRPFDEALDEVSSPIFGDTSKGLTQSQIEARKSAFNGYLSLVEGEPLDRRKEIAQTAARAKFSSAFKDSPQSDRKKALVKQSRRRRGAGVSKAPPAKRSAEEEFAKRLRAIGATQ